MFTMSVRCMMKHHVVGSDFHLTFVSFYYRLHLLTDPPCNAWTSMEASKQTSFFLPLHPRVCITLFFRYAEQMDARLKRPRMVPALYINTHKNTHESMYCTFTPYHHALTSISVPAHIHSIFLFLY